MGQGVGAQPGSSPLPQKKEFGPAGVAAAPEPAGSLRPREGLRRLGRARAARLERAHEHHAARDEHDAEEPSRRRVMLLEADPAELVDED